MISPVLLAAGLESSLGDKGLAIASASLLTMVFRLRTCKREWPCTADLMFLNKLYASSYLEAMGLVVVGLFA